MGTIKANQFNIVDQPTQEYHVLTKSYAENYFGNSILPLCFYHIGGVPQGVTDRIIYVGPGSIGFFYIPVAAKVLYMTISSVASVTAGSITAYVTLGGVKQSSLNVLLNTTNPLSNSSTFSSGNSVSSGTRVGVVVTTTGDFEPVDSDMQIILYLK